MKRNQVLEKVQLIISIFIICLFIVGLIPFYFDNIYETLFFLIIIQIIISAIRNSTYNLVIELILLLLAFLSLIPLLGYLFRLIGIIIAILDLIKVQPIGFMKVNLNTKNWNTKKNNKSIKKKKDTDFQDAEYKEK